MPEKYNGDEKMLKIKLNFFFLAARKKKVDVHMFW